MTRSMHQGRWLWPIAAGAWALAAGILLCRDIRIANAGGDIGTPPARPVMGAASFCDNFRTPAALRGWTTVFPWGDRHLGQGEQEEYVGSGRRLDPFSTGRDGLTITARSIPVADRADFGGQKFASGLLTSYHLFRQRYGYFEIRAKFPAGSGLWPAFWLAPADLSWPPEIDIVEMRGDRPHRLEVTLHRQGRSRRDVATEFTVAVPDMTAAFHTYGLLWTPRYVAWYFDGHRIAFTGAAGLTTKMYLLIDLAVGGDWVGMPDAATQFPARMDVAYVRAFRLPGQAAVGTTSVLTRCSNEKGG